MNVRDVPERVHTVLAARALARHMSLRAYVVEILADHAATPTVDEWLADVAALPPAPAGGSAVEALTTERDERDDDLAHAARRR